jgi:DNA-binding MurR/RpiR family transcriptional regulator
MIGEYFSKLLMQVNKSTVYAYESHIIDLLSNKIDSNDMVIFISSSGETKTIVKVAEKLKFQNRQTAAITNTSDCTLAKLVSVSVSANAHPVQYAGYDLTARSYMMLLIDILFESYLLQTAK